jgi:flagellar hook-associated protein 2
MANASIGGLVSGLDTATIISQLMQLEAQPRTNLQSRVSSNQRELTALQTFNSKLAAIATQAADLAKASAWGGVKATSSSDKVAVTADAGVAAGSFSFTVNTVATAARETFGSPAKAGDPVLAPGTGYTVSFADGREPLTFDTGSGSLSDIAANINDAKGGVSATLIRVGTDGGDPTYRLQLTSKATGADSGFTVAETDPADPTASAPFLASVVRTDGTDASITLDGQTEPLLSSTNTITDLMPGVDVTLSAQSKDATTTITTALDTDGMSAKVKSLVDTINAAVTEAQSLTKYDAATKTSGLLAGDAAVRAAGTRIIDTVIAGVGGTSLADLGIQSDRTGKLVYDDTKFKAAYAADPTAVTTRLTAAADTTNATPGGMAVQLEKLAKTLSNSTDGTITLAIQGRTRTIDRLEDDIAAWDERLDQRKANLEKTYTALEVALGKLQSQGNWLAGQLNSLPQMNSGS